MPESLSPSQRHAAPSFMEQAQQLADSFKATAAERDARGGTPLAERNQLRASGLLALSIPRQYGGLGADWADTLAVVRRLAQADSSLAHVFGFQHLMLATVQLFGQPQQWQPWLEQTARHQWFWGNALNPLDRRTLSRRVAGGREFSGHKSFCSGAADAQMLIASALDESADGRLLIAAIPADRSGITVHGDWDNIGQRQTDSGSVSFERVRVEEQELLLEPGPLSTPYSCLRPLLAQLIFTNLFVGVAEGAFEDARHYTRHHARPWFRAGVASASADPYVLHHYGEFWAALEGARLLTDRANQQFDHAWQQGARLNAAERGALAVAITTAKVAASRTGLDLSSRLFEVTGARATHGPLRLDRYWRNLRTQTLHDPLDYKLNELGDWALNGQSPTPTFYS
ncbi:acyl-CoA dehydrogenase family protein [Isoalcanivorax beigongshangi]|uniref:Acyl-CoA dehydrogenase family protein n=1 Tax=Isoalcanivorax beigongshangi TaxID=3238810 RepID=A0ABV4AFQ9_9GAMM